MVGGVRRGREVVSIFSLDTNHELAVKKLLRVNKISLIQHICLTLWLDGKKHLYIFPFSFLLANLFIINTSFTV